MRINWLCRSFWLQRWQWLFGSFRPAVPRMHVRARRVRAARKKRKCTNHGARAIVVGKEHLYCTILSADKGFFLHPHVKLKVGFKPKKG